MTVYASVEEEIWDWAVQQDVFKLRPYILAHAKPRVDGANGPMKGPLTREELAACLKDRCAGGRDWKWTVLDMGSDSKLKGRLVETDPWFAIGDGLVISFDEVVAQAILETDLLGLVSDIAAGRIEPPAELARAPAGVPSGTSATARRHSPKAGTRSAARFGRARHRGRSNHDGSMDAHDNAREESEWNATSITARSSQPARPSSGNG